MKIQTKINSFIFILLMLFGMPIIIAGYIIISSIVSELNKELFIHEINTIYTELDSRLKTLEIVGVSGIKSYIKKEKKHIIEKYEHYTFHKTGQLMILDTESNVVLHPTYPKGEKLPLYFLDTILKEQQGTLNYHLHDKNYISAYRIFPKWKWVLILSANQEDIFISRQNYTSIAIAITFAIFVCMFLLSYLITRRISKRINYTIDTLKQIENGNLSIRINQPNNDEIGLIQQGINTMVEKVSAATRAEQEMNQSMRHEIEQRKNIEIELRSAKNAAETANQAKNEFIANISHELRTPMNGVLGMTDVLLESPINKEQKEYLNIIHNSGNTLLDIINELLDVFKLEAGKIKLDAKLFNFQRLIQDVNSLLQEKAKKKGLNFHIDLDKDLPNYYIGDKNRIRQILLNLAGNAIKFTHEGHVFIHITLKHLDAVQACLHFSIKDTGIGIPEEKQAILFEKFHQLDAAANRQYEGTGLGLYISQQLVELMQGEIGVESSNGTGSHFWFTIHLLLADNKEQACLPSPLSAKNPSNLIQNTILLVEDNLTNQKVAKIMLDSIGCHVTIANNGKEALEMLESQHFDVVLMDIQMPVLDGYSATQCIRNQEQNTNEHLTIIAITANALACDVEKCFAVGMDDFLAKPVSKVKLTSMLEKWLNATPNVARLH